MPSAPARPSHPFRPRATRRRLELLLALLALAAGVGCGAGPAPTDLDVTGTVVLPAGSSLDLATLRALGPYGESSLSPEGQFTVPMALAGPGIVAVTNGAGDLVLLGFLDTDDGGAEISGVSTAAALLYLAVGGPFMPGPVENVLDLVADDPVLAGLAVTINDILGSDPLALAGGDEDLIAAVIAARAEVAGRNATGPGVGIGDSSPRTLPTNSAALASSELFAPAAPSAAGNVIIPDAGQRGGFDLLISDDGLGVTVQNSLRRPGRLLLYRTGVKPIEGSVDEYEAGVPVGEAVTVPPTRSLNLFLALEDAIGGTTASAFAPIESQPTLLPLFPGSSRTYYQAVLLSPTLIPGDTPPIFTDPRFFPFRDDWDATLDDLNWETWWTSLLFPLMSTMAFGVTSQVAYESVAMHSSAVRATAEPLLAGAGIGNPLTGDRARAMIVNLEQAALGSDSTYFYELAEHTRQALGVKAPPPASLLSARTLLASLAKAAGVMAIVDALLASGDVVAMVYDMSTNGSAETYGPVRVDLSTKIEPSEGTVTRSAPSAAFELVMDEPAAGVEYRYRWSTSGNYGYLSDYLQDGQSLDTTRTDVLYIANDPASINSQLADTVTVEVYFDDGSGAIPEDAELVAMASARVTGEADKNTYAGRWGHEMDFYSTVGPFGPEERMCARAYVAVESKPGALDYELTLTGFTHPSWLDPSTVVWSQDYFPESPGFPDAPLHCRDRLEDGEYYIGLVRIDSYVGNPDWDSDYAYWLESFEGMVVEAEAIY